MNKQEKYEYLIQFLEILNPKCSYTNKWQSTCSHAHTQLTKYLIRNWWSIETSKIISVNPLKIPAVTINLHILWNCSPQNKCLNGNFFGHKTSTMHVLCALTSKTWIYTYKNCDKQNGTIKVLMFSELNMKKTFWIKYYILSYVLVFLHKFGPMGLSVHYTFLCSIWIRYGFWSWAFVYNFMSFAFISMGAEHSKYSQ